MSGALHRRVLLEAHAGHVTAALEDDFHHFAVRLEHDGQRVTSVEGQALRSPWASCPGAGAQLAALAGCELSVRPAVVAGHIDSYQQCTHQYDLALMALAQAVRGGRRDYLAVVADPVAGRRTALLECDGRIVLEWMLEGAMVVAGTALAGANLRKLDMAVLGAGDPDLAQAVSLLRRTVMVAGGRGVDFDGVATLEVFEHMTGACYAFQPARQAEGKRNTGTIRDFTGRRHELLRSA